MKKKVLVVGVTGVGGMAAAAAAAAAGYRVVGTRKKAVDAFSRPCPHVDVLVGGVDVTTSNWLDSVLSAEPGVYEFGFLAFAQGEVGFPADEATHEQQARALRASLQPLLDMEASGRFKNLVGFSSFHELDISQLVYGSMVQGKVQIDHWPQTATKAVGRYVIKSGGFDSKSLRGVKLATFRQLSRRQGNVDDRLVKAFGNPDVATLEQMLRQRLLMEENARFGNTRLTTGDDLVPAVAAVLRGAADDAIGPITCVVADEVFYLECLI